MTEILRRVCLGVTVTLAAVTYLAVASGPTEDCARFTSCRDCYDNSATCAWCSSDSSPDHRCVSLSAPLGPGIGCSSCTEERGRLAREVGTCDNSACLGVDGRSCSGHGTCDCGTCTCEPGYAGGVCQNCPIKWDDCPGEDGSFGSCCQNMVMEQCLDWPARCARCMRNEGNATLCDMCPRDTQIVKSDPGEPRSAECVFDSLSFSSNLHCSYHVYYWRDEAPALLLHARVQLVCGSAADKNIFPKRKEPEPETRPAAPEPEEEEEPEPLPPVAPETPKAPVTQSPPARPRAPPAKPREAAITERPEGAAKPASGAAAGGVALMVLLCSLWMLESLR